MSNLHQRIADALGWSLADAQSFSLPTLRAFVSSVNAKLADEIGEVIRRGDHVVRR